MLFSIQIIGICRDFVFPDAFEDACGNDDAACYGDGHLEGHESVGCSFGQLVGDIGEAGKLRLLQAGFPI